MHKAYDTCLEMFEQRGYAVTSQDDEERDCIEGVKEDGTQVCTFLLESSFRSEHVKEYTVLMKSGDIDHCIIVVRDKVTTAAHASVASLADLRIELFSVEELQTNISMHGLQPKFRLMKKNEVSPKIRKNLGTLWTDDPAARFFGYQRGDVVELTRPDGVGYRVVRQRNKKV
jgi:DNA-directed RNA polymerase subunit H (RpoH/RPB5)